MTTWSSRMRTSTGFKETSSLTSMVVFQISLSFPVLVVVLAEAWMMRKMVAVIICGGHHY